MCGILAALGLTGDVLANRRAVVRASKMQQHRGPDATAVYQSPDGKHFISFERLQIVDPSDGGRCFLQQSNHRIAVNLLPLLMVMCCVCAGNPF